MLVLLVGMLGRDKRNGDLAKYDRIILDCGQGNDRRLADVSQISIKLEEMHEGLSAAVIGFHSMTGTDFTSAFFGKGKKRPWSVLLKNLEYVEWFISLGLPEDPDETKCEEFVLLLYSLENSTDVNSARYNKL